MTNLQQIKNSVNYGTIENKNSSESLPVITRLTLSLRILRFERARKSIKIYTTHDLRGDLFFPSI